MSGDKDALIYLADVRIDELEAENDKLREQLADMPKCEDCEAMLDCDECLRADDSQQERKRLAYENAKLRAQVGDACMQLGGAWVRCTELRELVRFIMHQCNDGNPRCDECIGWNGGECVALQHMHELGIEVDA